MITIAKPGRKVYLAGKIGARDWRNALVPSLLDESTERYYSPDVWPVIGGAIMGVYDYVGPYFISCDHGCYHGDTRHGVGAFGDRTFEEAGCGGNRFDPYGKTTGGNRAEVLRLCRRAIAEADIVFAWIEDETAHGTIAEIGYAHALGKRVWIAGPQHFPELWLAYEMAERLAFEAPSAKIAFEALAAADGVGLHLLVGVNGR